MARNCDHGEIATSKKSGDSGYCTAAYSRNRKIGAAVEPRFPRSGLDIWQNRRSGCGLVAKYCSLKLIILLEGDWSLTDQNLRILDFGKGSDARCGRGHFVDWRPQKPCVDLLGATQMTQFGQPRERRRIERRVVQSDPLEHSL